MYYLHARHMKALSKDKKLEAFLLFVAIVVGTVFRLWFITLAPQPYGYDQYEYDLYAQKMFDSSDLIASHSYRNYPLPLFNTLVYKVVGFANHTPLFFSNAVMDSLTGVMVYLLLKHSIKK